jgi:hypothetical protein
MNAQQLLEILLQAANAGVDLSSLRVAFPSSDPDFSTAYAIEVEISDDELVIS